MPNLPATTQTDAVMQDQTTGIVDYLQFQGNQLTGIKSLNYGLGSTWKIVADGNFGGVNPSLVAQNQTTNQLDFLFLDANGNLVTSALSNAVPKIAGSGFYGAAAGQVGPTLISQLADGSLDFLAYNAAGVLIASDLVAGTAGLPTVVGTGTQANTGGALDFQGGSGNANVFTQLADGSIDVLSFSGSIANGTLSFAASNLLAQTVGTAPVVAVNPDFSGGAQTIHKDIPGLTANPGTFGVELLTQSAGGQAGVTYIDSGYNNTATPNVTRGDLYGTNQLNPGFSNQRFVNGSFVAQELFPLTGTPTALPVPTQTDVVVQDPTSGMIDYLKFVGTQLVGSDAVSYGIAGFKVVGESDFNADGKPDLLVQNASGQVEFLLLGSNAQLIGSALGSAVPNIIGQGEFGNVPNQAGVPIFVSQLANGSLDFLAFNTAGTLINSDLVASTAGLGKAVGVAESFSSFPGFSGIGDNTRDDVIFQGADGTLRAIGFTGNINGGTLAQSGNLLLSQSAGSPAIGTINPNVGFTSDPAENILGNTQQEVVQMIGQTASGQLDALYFDSGYGGDTASQGQLFASNLLSGSLSGFNIVNAGLVAHIDLFPIS